MAIRDLATSQISEAAVEEIRQLHAGIISHARTSLVNAIRIGEILSQIKTVLKNTNWIEWLQTNLPFSDRTARRYVSCYERRDQLSLDNLSNLSEAYALIASANGAESNGQPRLHESNFYSDSIRYTQTLMGKINHEIKDHPIQSWSRDNITTLAAALEPIAELYSKLKSLL